MHSLCNVFIRTTPAMKEWSSSVLARCAILSNHEWDWSGRKSFKVPSCREPEFRHSSSSQKHIGNVIPQSSLSEVPCQEMDLTGLIILSTIVCRCCRSVGRG